MKSPVRAASRTNGTIISPYFMKSLVLYVMFSLERIFVNIIPASAPIGVRYAPRFDPIMLAYTPKDAR